MDKITKIEIEGFKSIREMKLELGSLNVLIGANGSGKSNFISIFKMLNYMVTEALQDFIGKSGYADSLLYYGKKKTGQLKTLIEFETSTGVSKYMMRMTDAPPDILMFKEEKVTFLKSGYASPQEIVLGSGHKETLLNKNAAENKTVMVVRNILGKCQFFQFHDTSENAKIRNAGYINENIFLYKDAGNLAAYLYAMRQSNPESYQRIVATIKLIAPHFGDFELEPDQRNPQVIFLNWRERGGGYLFGPHQLPDGLLRAMALFTLLLQPEANRRPDVIVIDEPELGFHPVAIEILAALIREASLNRQIILATQSANLVNQFKPEDIIVVDRKKDAEQSEFESVIYRPQVDHLNSWLKDYTLSELWDKNIIGGRPGR